MIQEKLVKADQKLNQQFKGMRSVFLLAGLMILNILAAQHSPVDRNTGRKIACEELSCDNSDSTYEDLNRICLNCLFESSDSAMRSQVNNILLKCKSKRKLCDSFVKGQKSWELQRERSALAEGNKYKGGTMEITEYLRSKLIQTNKRVSFLNSYSQKL